MKLFFQLNNCSSFCKIRFSNLTFIILFEVVLKSLSVLTRLGILRVKNNHKPSILCITQVLVIKPLRLNKNECVKNCFF